MASEGAVQRVLVPAYAKQLSPATQLAIQRATSETGPENGTKLPPPRPEDMLSAAAALDLEESGPGATGELRHSLGFTASPCRTRGSGQKNSRRKRDLVLSVSELDFYKFFFILEREVKSDVWVDVKIPILSEWVLNPPGAGGKKEKSYSLALGIHSCPVLGGTLFRLFQIDRYLLLKERGIISHLPVI